jgi:cell fate regulator YaaT (PSP1 superfamily)
MKRSPEEKLLNPRPGSKIAEAQEYGIDLTLLVSNLRKSPQQRIEDLQSSMRFLEILDQARIKGPIKQKNS